MKLTTELKGQKDGNCNRTDCQKPGAVYYNYSTRKWYCPECAHKINMMNHSDAWRMFGHDLCIYNPDTTEVI